WKGNVLNDEREPAHGGPPSERREPPPDDRREPPPDARGFEPGPREHNPWGSDGPGGPPPDGDGHRPPPPPHGPGDHGPGDRGPGDHGFPPPPLHSGPGGHEGSHGPDGPHGPGGSRFDILRLMSLDLPIYLMIVTGAHAALFFRREQERA